MRGDQTFEKIRERQAMTGLADDSEFILGGYVPGVPN